MTTVSPLPSWADLVAVIHGSRITDEDLAKPWCQCDERVFWFSRSAWALQAITTWWEQVYGGRKPKVWLPDYFCNQSAEPMRRVGVTPVHYPVRNDLNPDWETCDALAKNNAPPDLFILVHYFGHAANGQAALDFCSRHGALLLEDAAHILLPENGIGKCGDFVFYSPHKMLAVPDGALLLANRYNKAMEPALINAISQLRPAPNATSWLIKRFLQKCVPNAALLARNRTMPGFNEDPLPIEYPETPCPSSIGRRLLARHIERLVQAQTTRKANALAWRRRSDKPGLLGTPLFDVDAEGTAPYRYVEQYASQEDAATAFRHYRQAGIPIETWPDLAPEVIEKTHRHSVAVALRKTLLLFPVHHALSRVST